MVRKTKLNRPRVSNRLKEIRMREYMLNQKEFAEKLGIPATTYRSMESGLVVGQLETAFIIATALGLKIEEIWHFE